MESFQDVLRDLRFFNLSRENIAQLDAADDGRIDEILCRKRAPGQIGWLLERSLMVFDL